MANRLSDDELRKSLLAHGENVGPITTGTRSVYEKRLATIKKSKGSVLKSSALNALSSDDSEIENASTSTRKKRTHRTDPSPPGDIFKKPAAVYIPVSSQDRRLYQRSKKSKKTTKNSSFDVETSDSDFDSDASGRSPGRPRRKSSLSQGPSPEVAVPRRTEGSDDSLFRRTDANASWNSESEDSLLRFSPTLERLRRERSQSFHPPSNGYLPSNANNGEGFAVKGSSTNHSHCVSWLLVFGAVAFFVIVGALYITEVQRNNPHANNNLSFCDGVLTDDEKKAFADDEKELCQSFIVMCKELHSLLTKIAGDFECGNRVSRNLTIAEAKMIMKDTLSTDNGFQMDHFDDLYTKSLQMFKRQAQWNINCSNELSEEQRTLEASVASKSLWCRVRSSARWTAARILFLIGVCVTMLLCWVGVHFWRKRREAQENLFYEMVEKVIDMLQDQQESDNCRAVVNIRDALIPPKERRHKLWLWDRVVAFVEESESRVSVEYHTINGEDFKVWRCHHHTPETEGGKHGKVWQGQAFGSVSKVKAAVYSPCLKIRNMFDPEAEYGDSWQVSTQDAILEKCEGNNGIRHIAVETSNSEGFVYVLCDSSESAGKAYNDLHGWWFDGKLVTVKYLPLKRYLERFPSANHLTVPLRPSNDRRLSLARPFFSSALERS